MPRPKKVKNDDFQLIENQILKNYTRVIRLVPLNKKRKESLQEFLEFFFTKWNQKLKTIYTDNREVQTDIGKRRSLGDIYMLCKYYYPNTTVRELLNLLYFVLPKSLPKGFRTAYCYEKNKRMWYFSEGSNTQAYNINQEDEFGHDYRFYEELLSKKEEEITASF